jgi:putative transposase
MGRATSNVDNALIQSFPSTMQRELLDRQHWNSRVELTPTIVEWIEGWYEPPWRRSPPGMLSPHGQETLDSVTEKAA